MDPLRGISVNYHKDSYRSGGDGDGDPNRFAKFVAVAVVGSLIAALPAQLYYDYVVVNEANDLEVNVTNENGTTVIRISSNRTIIRRS